MVINACDSTGAEADPGTAAIADAFSDLGCPAVIAMRGKIPGQAASRFASAFYNALAHIGIDRPDKAYARALTALSEEPNNGSHAWFMPRLVFQRGCAEVFSGLEQPFSFVRLAMGKADLAVLTQFMDREQERHSLYHAPGCWLDHARPTSPVLLLKGDAEVGKSWLLKCLVFIAQQRGLRTVYWDFEQPAPALDPLDDGYFDSDQEPQRKYDLDAVLRALRIGQRSDNLFFAHHPWPQPPAPGPFTELDALLAAAPDQASRGSNEDSRLPKMKAFVRGLLSAAKHAPDRPLIVALDHIDWIIPEDWDRFLHQRLLSPVARGMLGADIRVMIAGTADELRWFDSLNPAPEVMPIGPFRGNQYADLMFRYLLNHYEGSGKQGIEMVNRYRDLVAAHAAVNGDKDWKPSELCALAKVLRLVSRCPRL